MKSKSMVSYFHRGFFWGSIFFLLICFVSIKLYPFYKKPNVDFNYLSNQGMSKSTLVSTAFFSSLQHMNAVLVFGTSETGILGTKPSALNYWALANNRLLDKNIFIYTTAGAGNTPYMWIHNICDIGEDTIVYYLVNPIYFTNGLNTKSRFGQYSDRYLSKSTLDKTKNCLENRVDKDLYDHFQSLFPEQSLTDITIKSELAFFLNEFKNYLSQTIEKEKPIEAKATPSKARKLDADLNPEMNVADWIVKGKDLSGAKFTNIENNFTNSESYKELKILAQLTQSKKIKMRYIFMPPNSQFFLKQGSSYPARFEEIKADVFKMLCNNNNCIDLIKQEDAKGLFLDTMHLSAYGAQVVADELVKDICHSVENSKASPSKCNPL